MFGSVHTVTRIVFDVVPSRGGSAACAFSYFTIVCMDTVCVIYPCIEVRGAPLCLEGPSGIFS